MSLEKRTKVKSNSFDSPINIGIVTASNITVTGIASVRDLVVTNSIKGSPIDATAIGYSIVFGL
jgi:hypothetical protein